MLYRWLVVCPAVCLVTIAPARADDPPMPVAVPIPEPAADGKPEAKPQRVFDPATTAALEDEDLAPVVKARLRQGSLREGERRAIRLRHGVWSAEDLGEVADRAWAALDRGAYDDGSLRNPGAPALARAEAHLARGELDEAIKVVEGDGSMRAVLVRVRALVDLGRVADALKAGEPALGAMNAGTLATSDEITAAVRAAAILFEHRPPQGQPGDDHRTLIALLGRARQADPLDWRVRLAEAELLFDKDNFEEAQGSIREALALNPGAAEAWTLLGHMAVAGFNMPEAERIAGLIDRLATMTPRSQIAREMAAEHAEHEGEGDEGEEPEGARPIGTKSPLAAGVRARAMMRQDNPELAEEALAGAIAAYPARRDLREWAIGVSALRYDWVATQALLDEHDRLSPGSARGYFEAGRAMSDARQYAQAARWLAVARQRAPHWSALAAELGLLEVQSGRDREAIEALEKAAALDPFNVRVENSLKLMREIQTYDRTESEHFIIRSRPGVDTLLAREMVPVLERMHAIVTGDSLGALDYSPPQKTVIDLMPDHQWFAVRIAGLPAIHTIAASTGPVIAMETPRTGRGHKGTYDWERVVRHEYVHTVGLSRTSSRIPHWFTEANAVFLELAPRDMRVTKLLSDTLAKDGLFDFSEINIAFTRPRKPTDRALAYAQGHWMFEYMVERFGREAPLRLMDLYAKGVREEQGFQTVLGIGRERFMEDFKVWAGRQVASWGMRPPEGVPGLADLWAEAEKEHEASGAKEPLGDEATPEMIERWLTRFPGHPEVLALKVRKALAANPKPGPEMRPLLEAFAKARPVDPMPVRHLARLALSGGTPTEAIPYLEWLDAREQSTPTYAAQLAALYYGRGDLDKASDKAERATRVAPYEASHRELAATIAVKRGDKATARRHIQFLMALEPDREVHKRRLEALERLN